MEDVYKKLKKNLNWRERIVLKLFKKTFFKIYNIKRIEIVNKLLKS